MTPIVGMLQLRAEVDGEAGPARVVAAGGVDDQDVGRRLERAHRLLQHRTGAQREQAGAVLAVRSSPIAVAVSGGTAAAAHAVSPVAARAGLIRGEADEAARDARMLGRLPRIRTLCRQRRLRGDQRVDRVGPLRHVKRMRSSLHPGASTVRRGVSRSGSTPRLSV